MGGDGKLCWYQTHSSMTMNRHIPLEDIRDAEGAIYAVAMRTPLVRLPVPDDSPLGRTKFSELYLKLETLQPIGSFKIRGAYNTVRQLTPNQLSQGIWTVSAGNAGQGVALAARTCGAKCSVMVMDTAPTTKLAAIERLGAQLVKASHDECWQAVENHASERMDGVFVHPFDDNRFIAGNATAGLEILEDLPDVDAVVASIGGGGLISGVAAAIKQQLPGCAVYGVEPVGADSMRRSIDAGTPVAIDAVNTIADSLGAPHAAPYSFSLIQQFVDDVVLVDDAEIRVAMRALFEDGKLVPEPASAAPLAAICGPLRDRLHGKRVALVLSGSNIDLTTFTSHLLATPTNGSSR